MSDEAQRAEHRQMQAMRAEDDWPTLAGQAVPLSRPLKLGTSSIQLHQGPSTARLQSPFSGSLPDYPLGLALQRRPSVWRGTAHCTMALGKAVDNERQEDAGVQSIMHGIVTNLQRLLSPVLLTNPIHAFPGFHDSNMVGTRSNSCLDWLMSI